MCVWVCVSVVNSPFLTIVLIWTSNLSIKIYYNKSSPKGMAYIYSLLYLQRVQEEVSISNVYSKYLVK